MWDAADATATVRADEPRAVCIALLKALSQRDSGGDGDA